jgi:hypothetical protein
LTGRPASASFSIDRICVSVNFDWRMGFSWLGWLLCQKVLRLDHLRLGELTHGWKAACKRVEATGKTFHAPRRTGVGTLDCTGLPETVAMKISGCKAWTRFDRYNITREEDLRKVVKWLILYIQRKRVTVSLEYRTYLISLLCQSLHLSKNNGGEI